MTYQLHCCGCAGPGVAEDVETATRLSARHTAATGHAVIAVDAVATRGEVGRPSHALDARAPRTGGSAAGLATTAAPTFDEMMTAVGDATDDWERKVIEQAILAIAATGRPFSMNDVRDRLPELTSNNKIGPRLLALAHAERIAKIPGRLVWSTKGSTRHRIQVWIRADLAPIEAVA